MSHFLSILCGLASVLTEVGDISKSYLSAVLLGRENKQQRETNTNSQLREQQVFIGVGVEVPIIILGVMIS